MNEKVIFKYNLILILTLSIMGLFSCTSKSPDEKKIKTIFVKGDPYEVIAGAKSNPVADFKSELNESLGTFELVSGFVFEEQEPVNKKSHSFEEAKSDQKPKEVERLGSEYQFKFSKVSETEAVFKSALLTFSLEMNEQKKWIFTKLKSIPTADEFDFKMIHFSHNEDMSVFSLLFESNSAISGKQITAYYFEKLEQSKNILRMVSNRFKYMFGNGKAMGWDQNKKLELKVCGRNISPFQFNVSLAVKSWKSHLNNRLYIDLKNTNDYPPFSDVNVHCIHMVNAYLTVDSEKLSNPGFATLAPSWTNNQILDSDVFFIKSEIEKLVPIKSEGFISSELYRISRHELGHLLGLHHQFDGTESIMSYDDKHTSISAYDIEAIEALYPECDMKNSECSKLWSTQANSIK